jgi:hypothetical protein
VFGNTYDVVGAMGKMKFYKHWWVSWILDVAMFIYMFFCIQLLMRMGYRVGIGALLLRNELSHS